MKLWCEMSVSIRRTRSLWKPWLVLVIVGDLYFPFRYWTQKSAAAEFKYYHQLFGGGDY